MGLLSKEQNNALDKAGIKKEQVKIVVHNLEELINAKKVNKAVVEIVVHNLVSSEAFRGMNNKNNDAISMPAIVSIGEV
jgi:hypothetical protein